LRRPNRALVVGFGLSLVGAVAGLALTGATHLPGALAAETAPSPASPPAPTYVGSEACAGCHQPEAKLWNGSHHQLAMDHATEKSVLGDFAGATFEHYGVKSRFFRRDGKFFVETDGQDGRLAEFEVKYTFGVYPLQQYLIEFPDGRLQALSIAWDSRPKDKGGQRWFHLYPNEEVGHDDILHWTKLNQNWNFMCAECHSTGVRKNYDAAKNTFATTWAEISVGCETCHGQGSAHVAWAHNNPGWREAGKDDDAKGLIVRFDERKDAGWTIDPSTGNATRAAPPATLRKEVETCGLCHARRGTIAEDWFPGRWLSETHVTPPLSHGLFFADGQMEDEVYNYGSFKQSKMFARGVTCSDCHDPHSAKVKLPGDGVCLQCHAASKYTVAAHSRHEGVEPPVGCASCHMPTRTYMVVDPRHDHSLRIPRPDLSVKLGTPNACNACHADKTAQWAADAVQSWHGPERKGFQRYAEAFHDAWSGGAEPEALLTAAASDRETPGFARAGALADLAPYLSQSTVGLAKSSLADPDPMVRIGALDMLGNAPAQDIWPLAAPLLSDPVRGVRIRAADLLAAVPSTRQPASDRAAFDRAAQEFVAAQALNADRPEARLTLGSFRARRGETAEAEAQYKAALALAPQFAPAAVNLADLYRQTGRDAEGEAVLRASLAASPKDAGLHYALGLALIRLKKPEAALGELRQADSLAPENAQNVYVYAIALNSAGRSLEARKVLADALAAHPDNRDILTALVQMSQQAGDLPSALLYAERLARLMPNDPDLARFVEELRRATVH
jgi:predicted CXXCH cytochrome family protein